MRNSGDMNRISEFGIVSPEFSERFDTSLSLDGRGLRRG
jgi:hypothetical protein